MGYACPVCEAPQQDAGHLANHLAFTAMLGDDDHEAWLDEHAPGWAEQGERDLADRVADHAEETEFPQVFEDTTGDGDDREPAEERSGALFGDDAHGHAHGQDHHEHGASDPGHQHGHDLPTDVDPGQHTADPDDPETQEILDDAREMTREMLGVDEDETGHDETDSTTDDGDDHTADDGDHAPDDSGHQTDDSDHATDDSDHESDDDA